MQSKLTIIIFALSILFIAVSCLLDILVPRVATSELEALGRFFVGLFGSGAFIGFGLTLITVSDDWLEKHIPLYRRDKQPSKLIVGIVGITVGVMAILLDIGILIRFLKN